MGDLLDIYEGSLQFQDVVTVSKFSAMREPSGWRTLRARKKKIEMRFKQFSVYSIYTCACTHIMQEI